MLDIKVCDICKDKTRRKIENFQSNNFPRFITSQKSAYIILLNAYQTQISHLLAKKIVENDSVHVIITQML